MNSIFYHVSSFDRLIQILQYFMMAKLIHRDNCASSLPSPSSSPPLSSDNIIQPDFDETRGPLV